MPRKTLAAGCAAISCAAMLAAGVASAQGLRLPGGGGRGGGSSSSSSDSSSSSGGIDTSTPQVNMLNDSLSVPSLNTPLVPMPQVGSDPLSTGPAAGPQNSRPAGNAGIQLGDAIVAVVNSDIITRRELDERTRAALATLGRQQIAPPDTATLQRQVLERMIVERTQMQEAKAQNIKVDDAQLDSTINRIAQQNKVSVSQMRDQIEREGLPFSTYREDLRQEIVLMRLRERAVDSQVLISEPEIDAYLADQRNQAASTSPALLTLSQILVRVPEGSSSDVVARLRHKAETLLQQARSSADFARLAAASSDGEEALQGGDLGTRPASRWPSIFVQAVANLSPGGVSDIVQSPNGFHIIKLVERKSADGVPDAATAPVTQTHARHILIRTSQVLNSDQAREKLANIRARIVEGGVNFQDMARQYSNDASAPQGGDLGWVSPSETVPEFEHAMDALKPGEISQPVQSPFGWHLIQVVERRTQDVSQERQRAAARQTLFQRKVDQAYEDWARQLRDKAYVEIRLPGANSSTASAN